MIRGKFNVVTDGQWGSCGKGLITTALAARFYPEVISTTNMANAGHTAVNISGEKHVAKALPSAAILSKWLPGYAPGIVVGATAAFQLGQMLHEIEICGVRNSTFIHPRAGVITLDHEQSEKSGNDSTKHVASTMQGCGTFLADKILRRKGLKLAGDYAQLADFMPMVDMACFLNDTLKEGGTILHEGAQGFSLDINHGSHYPNCTSRGTTAVQNLADMGISPKFLGKIYLVIRPYPIRVGNVYEGGMRVGDSGGHYPDHKEICWKEVADAAEMPKQEADSLMNRELTTVTKRLRRVFEFSPMQLRQAAIVNGADEIALNFANYIDWKCSGCDDWRSLPEKVMSFIGQCEKIAGIPVTIVGTGPQTNHVCWRPDQS